MAAPPPEGPDLSRLRLADHERDASPRAPLPWKSILLGAGLVVLGGLGAWFARGALQPAVDPAPPSTPTVQPLPVPTAPGSVLAGGRVEASARRELSFAAPGVVSEVRVARGAQVKAGDVLIELAAEPERADVAQEQASLDAARARLDELREGARPEELDQARRDVEAALARAADATEKSVQAQGLLKSGATTRAQALEAQRTAEAEEARARAAQAKAALLERGTRKTSLTTAEAEVARARANLAQAQARLALRKLVAPVDGTVVEVRVHSGEATGSDLPPPVVLADLAHLVAKVDVPEGKATRVRVGDPAVITVEALSTATFHGRVTELGLEADRQKGTLEVTVAFDDHEDLSLVRPRMAARVAIDVKHP